MRMLLATLLLAVPASAIAQDCALPSGFTAWRSDDAGAGAITLGRPARLDLKPVAGFPWSAPLSRAAAADTFGTETPLEIHRAGLYWIVLDQPAWIDLLKDGRAVASADHQHGEPCTGIRKIVGFRLGPGRYTIQLSASPAATVRVMVVPG